MKQILLSILLTFPLIGFSQKTVILTKYPQKVPEGKKWFLVTNQEILIEVSQGVLNSGSICNARFFSNPHILTGIVEGEYGRPNEIYGVLFKNFSKVAYTNNFTFNITPISYVKSDFDLSELYSKDPIDVGQRQIKFIQGQKVFVGECMNNIQVIEKELTPKEISDIQEKEKERELAERNRKKKEEEKKQQAEIKWKEKVKNSNEYYYSNSLTNENDIKISVSPKALEILNRFIQSFKKEYKDAYDFMNKTYQDNLKYASSRGDKPEDYAFFNLSLYFGKDARLTKITIDKVLIKGKGLTKVEIPDPYYSALVKNISINKSGVISINNTDFKVNSYYFLSLTPSESSEQSTFEILKTKKGEIKFKTNPNIPEDIAINLINNDPKIKALNKGKYIIVLETIKTKIRASHSQNFNQKEIIQDTFFTIEIKEVLNK